jgi:hypothetical protein
VAFWDEKVVCEQCNKKAKKKASIYRRGSRFCREACLMEWEAANPPPIARGDEASLTKELVIVMDEAFAEAHRRFGPGLDIPFGKANVRIDISFTGMGEAHRAEAMATAYQLFQSHTLRCAPILRALGYTNEATAIDSHDFLSQPSEPLLRVLARVRSALHSG